MSETINDYTATEVELIYKGGNPEAKTIKITTSNDCFKVLRAMWDDNRIYLLEEFKMIVLDNDGSLLGVSHISTGSINSCMADPKIIFTTALMARSASIVVAHNHPSTSLIPSEADMHLTRKLVEIGKHLDIKVHDHLIVTSNRYYSFADNSVMPV